MRHSFIIIKKNKSLIVISVKVYYGGRTAELYKCRVKNRIGLLPFQNHQDKRNNFLQKSIG